MGNSRIMKFKEFITENTNIEEIPKLKSFIEELQGYVLYNDDESRNKLLKFLNEYKEILIKMRVIKKFKKLYRIVALYNENDYKSKDLSSFTKKKYTGKYLEEIKDTIGQYTDIKNKDFYWIEIDNVIGFDFNAFGKLFQGKKKYFTNKYDSQGDMAFDVFYDAIKDLKKQNEVIIFNKHKIANIQNI